MITVGTATNSSRRPSRVIVPNSGYDGGITSWNKSSRNIEKLALPLIRVKIANTTS